MSALTVIWIDAANVALMRLSMADAQAIAERVEDFARTMTGPVARPILNGFIVRASGINAALLVQEDVEFDDDGDRWTADVCWVLSIRREQLVR